VVERVTEGLDTTDEDLSLTVTATESAPVAVVHSDGPEPSVEVSVTNGARTVEVAVHDDGPGIPDHELDVRELPAESALEHGNRLGLRLVDWFVEQSDGDLYIETNDDGSSIRTVLRQG
jgi:signal transduction histidine kinase